VRPITPITFTKARIHTRYSCTLIKLQAHPLTPVRVHNTPMVHLVPLGWSPSTPNVQPIRGRIAICDTLPIRGTTTSPAMPRLGDGACVCLCRRRQVWASLTLCSFILPYQRHLTISRSFLTFAVFSHSFIPWLLWALAPATT
jgi:hypothetical protein